MNLLGRHRADIFGPCSLGQLKDLAINFDYKSIFLNSVGDSVDDQHQTSLTVLVKKATFIICGNSAIEVLSDTLCSIYQNARSTIGNSTLISLVVSAPEIATN